MSADFVARMVGALALVAVVARIGVSEVTAYGDRHEGVYVATMAFYLRCLGPYLVLLACFIALGGVFEGSGGAPPSRRSPRTAWAELRLHGGQDVTAFKA